MQLNSLCLYCFRVKTLTGTSDERNDLNALNEWAWNICYLWTLQLVPLFFSIICCYLNKILHAHDPPTHTSNFFQLLLLELVRKACLDFINSRIGFFQAIRELIVGVKYVLKHVALLCLLVFANYFLNEIINEELIEKNNVLQLVANNIFETLITFPFFSIAVFMYFTIITYLFFSFVDGFLFWFYHICCYFFLRWFLTTVVPTTLSSFCSVISFAFLVVSCLSATRFFCNQDRNAIN